MKKLMLIIGLVQLCAITAAAKPTKEKENKEPFTNLIIVSSPKSPKSPTPLDTTVLTEMVAFNYAKSPTQRSVKCTHNWQAPTKCPICENA